MKPPAGQSWQFRDQKIPARLLYLLKLGESDGGITATDLLLSCVIDALVKPQGDETGLGCYASNEYLGAAAGAHPTYVPQRFKRLEELCLLLVVRLKGQRYLEMEWSRTAEERAALEGGYGVALRRAYEALEKRLKDRENEGLENPNSPLGIPKAPPLEIPKAAPLGISKQKSKEEDLTDKEVEKGARTPGSAGRRDPPLRGTKVHFGRRCKFLACRQAGRA